MAAPLNDRQRAALEQVAFDYTLDLRTIWRDPAGHVADVNGDVMERILRQFERETRPGTDTRPLGWAVVGRAGAGKTHLLGTLRREVWRQGGWFVLLDLLDVNDFWDITAQGFIASLLQPMPDGRSQALALFDRLRGRLGLPETLTETIQQPGLPAWSALAREFSAAVRRADARGTLTHRDTVFAFLALLSGEAEVQDYGHAWLTGADIDAAGKLALQLLRSQIPPRKAVEGLSWLMSLAGPTICALDQIDAIVSVAHASHDPQAEGAGRRARAIIDELAGGLMDLREVAHRSVTVVTALEATWEILTSGAIGSFKARFQTVGLRQLGEPEAARRMVELRLAPAYARAGFAPPYPSWPFRPESFAGVTQFSPRQLLQQCDAQIQAILARDAIDDEVDPTPIGPPPPAPTPDPGTRSPLDQRYAVLLAEGAPPGLLDQDGDDQRVVDLLIAGLRALVRQTALPPTMELAVETSVTGLHARLRLIHDSGLERHHCFRAIAHSNAVATLSRLQAAITASGIDRELPFRHLVILRRGDWPSGPRTAAVARQFELNGGKRLAPDAQDFARFAALRTLMAEPPPGLDAWLRTTRPLDASPFFQALGLLDVPTPPDAAAAPPSPAPPASQPTAEPASVARPSAIPLGVRVGDRQPVALSLAALPRHVTVIAGAGSGKTVLLRRLIEESALAGVPSIVLDSNNDLVHLADAWPERPATFSDEDAAKAARLARAADVVIWTPGRSRGNPLSLAPLPDFAAIGDDEDDLNAAIGITAAMLMKLIAAGAGARGQLKAGVLAAALRHFARLGGGGMADLIAMLSDLPAEASSVSNAGKLGKDIADALTAAMARNPLLDGAGTPLDPAVLLGGPPGRVRISVVNLAGLPGEDARQDFIGRLLLALFGHIRRHPARGRPAMGLLVMDEAQNFAASDRASPSREATLALVRQARKYGLGMIFATQTPKAIDHTILANSATQLFGLTNSPAALDAVRELLRSRGGGGEDLGRLPRGQFWMTSEGAERPQKIATPLCLTWHPPSPPSEDEVIARAARARDAARYALRRPAE